MRRPSLDKFTALFSLIVAIILISVALMCVILLISKSDDDAATREDGVYYTAAVAADVGKCSDVGVNFLKKNGSAVDAAVATLFCLGATNVHSSGIGGGLFMVVYMNKTGESWFYNGREKAPGNASRDMFVNKTGASKQGALAVGVPGEVRAMHKAWLNHGRLPWHDLVQPAIQLCKNGFQIHNVLYNAMKRREELLRNDTGFRKLFFKKDGTMLGLNDKLINLELGQTLEKIANDPTSFYNGTLAKQLTEEIQNLGGIITEEDLRNYDVRQDEALRVAIDEKYSILTSQPPSSGAVLAMTLKILKGFQFTAIDVNGDQNSTRTYHRIIEAFKFAFAYRALLGDPTYEPEVKQVVKNMTDDSFTENLRLKIFDNMTHNVSYYGGYYSDWNDGGTTHLSVVSKDGDAVAVTSTINTWFGSKVRSPKLGIIFNNEMDDFSTPGLTNVFGVEPSPSNYIKPGKRMMSSMAPTVVVDKSGIVRLVLGASGGTRIPTGIAQVLMNYLWFEASLQEAVKHPRVHHQLVPNYVRVERDEKYKLRQTIVDGLSRLGHMYHFRTSSSTVQAVAVDERARLHAMSDPRKEGRAAGY